MAELREKQMTAKSNKDYLACINGIEEAKQEKRLARNQHRATQPDRRSPAGAS